MAFYEPTELRYWDKSKAWNGYTLFDAGRNTYLVDMEGQVVNTWPTGKSPFLLDTGHLIDRVGGPGEPARFQERDWDGNIVWECVENRRGYAPHHDFKRIFNKKLNAPTTMYIANKSISHEQAIAAGCDPQKGPYDNASIDVIVERDMDGKIVWEWWFFDHVVQDIDPNKANYIGKGKTLSDFPGRLSVNLPGRPMETDWLHCNGVDYNADLDQVAINSVHGEFYIIDHGKTFIQGDSAGSIALAAGPAGEFLYRFGDPVRYGQGEPQSMSSQGVITTGHKQFGGSHNIQWIKPGLPGSGHLLVFNNGGSLFDGNPQSYIFEINQYLDADGRDTGNYVNPPGAGYYTWKPANPRDSHKQPKQISNQVVWIYNSERSTAFFGYSASGCQRLPNGNTLICSSTEGHLFEVTKEGEVVWEYINPVTREGNILEVIPDCNAMTNHVWRAYRYAPDHPALAGHKLISRGNITGKKGFQIIR